MSSMREVESAQLAGLTIRTTTGLVVFVEPGDGPAGVREPRQPKRPAPSAAAALPVPEGVTA